MTLSQGFFLGLKTYSQANTFIRKNGLRRFFLYPLILNILLFTLGFYTIGSYSDDFTTWISTTLDVKSWEFWGADFLSSAMQWIIRLMIRLLFLLAYAYLGGYLIIIMMAPVFAIISEKTEQILSGNSNPFQWAQFFKDIRRGILLALRNLSIEIFFTIILVFLSFIPVVGIFTTVTLFLVSAYFYGFSFIDYTLERKKLNVKNSIQFIKQNKGLAIGNGTIFSLVLLIPFIGVTLAGFLSIVSVVAATLATHKACAENTTQNTNS